jgi:kinetochor protein Mis14/NSL1
MDTHHRKIDLQSPSDLTYLLNNIKAAAQEKLDLAIPASAAPEGEDAYRTKVEELVQEVGECSHRAHPFP